MQSYEKLRAKQKNLFFFCRDGVTSLSQTAKLRKVEGKTKEFILFLPRRSKFGEANVNKNPVISQTDIKKSLIKRID